MTQAAALFFATLAIALAGSSPAAGQPSTSEGTPLGSAAAALPAQEPGSNLTVYLVTMGPGDQVWEKFGHNAIWIHDEANKTDIAYHWGVFDFADKEFIPRFLQGRMRYSMDAFDMNQTLEAYRRTNRMVWAQELNLSPAQREKLAQFVAWNVQPENRYYAYDYYRDNCSTRVRDALDGPLNGAIRRASDSIPSHSTYRFHTSRLTQDDWGVFTGTMMGLGQPVDRPINAWEEMFLPVRMMDRFRSITVSSASGPIPLVRREMVLLTSTRPPEPVKIQRGMLGYLAMAAVILLSGFGLWHLSGKDGRGNSVLLLAVIWSLVAGLGGTLLAGLWGLTDHLYSYRNENLLQLTPLSLVLAVLLIRLSWLRRRRGTAAAPTAVQTATRVAAVVAALSLIGFALQILPGFDQVNGDVIALAMPLHLGLLALLVAVGKREITSGEET